jgi:hypothetical protein
VLEASASAARNKTKKPISLPAGWVFLGAGGMIGLVVMSHRKKASKEHPSPNPNKQKKSKIDKGPPK